MIVKSSNYKIYIYIYELYYIFIKRKYIFSFIQIFYILYSNTILVNFLNIFRYFLENMFNITLLIITENYKNIYWFKKKEIVLTPKTHTDQIYEYNFIHYFYSLSE